MVHIMKCRDLGFNDDFLVIDDDSDAVKEKMAEHIRTVHREDFEAMSDFHQEEIMSKMDFLLRRGCGCGVLKL